MTERGREAVERGPEHLSIGPSAMAWQGDSLIITLDEIAAPIPKRVRGTIRVTPLGRPATAFALDDAGRHYWQPIAPQARIEVTLDQPNWRWTGSAYLDSNFGMEPLEAGFRHWTWSRAHRARDAVVLYDAERRDGSAASLALRFDAQGGVEALAPPPIVALPRTGWRLGRTTRADGPVRVIKNLEDTPFYARALLSTTLDGESALGFHESLSLDRFQRNIIRLMLPFRMPRRLF